MGVAPDAIVGRERELAAVRAALEPTSALVVLVGEPGIGKTTVWEAACNEARAQGMRVMAARCAKLETALPFVTLSDLLESVADDVLALLDHDLRIALEVALLHRVPAQTSDIGIVAAATRAALFALASEQPLLLAVDDVQWLDHDSSQALSFALRRIGDEPIRLLATRPSADSALRSLDVREVEIAALDAHVLESIVRSRFGIASTLAEAVALQRRSAGNPLYAIELARAGGLEGSRLPASVAALFRERLLRRPPATRLLLAALASAAHASVDYLRRAGFEEEAIDDAAGHDFIWFDREVVRFTHPLVAAAALELTTPRERRAIHRRLAEAEPSSIEHFRHLALAAAAPDASLADALEDAAANAARRGAADAGAVLADHSARLTPPGDAAATTRRTILLADCVLASGDVRRYQQTLEQLLGQLEPGTTRAEVLVRLANEEPDEARAVAYATCALEEATADPALVGAIHVRLALLERRTGRLDQAVTHADVAAEIAADLQDEYLLASALTQRGRIEAEATLAVSDAIFAAAAAAEAAAGKRLPLYEGPATIYGQCLLRAGRIDEARAALLGAWERSEEEPSVLERRSLNSVLVELAATRGDRDEATERLQHGEPEFFQSDLVAAWETASLARDGMVALFTGDFDRAAQLATRGLERAVGAGSRTFEIPHRWVLAGTALAREDFDSAWTAASPPLVPGPPRPLNIFETILAGDAAEAAAGLGLAAEARRLADAVAHALGTGSPRLEVAAHRARAHAALTTGDVEGALRATTAAAAVQEDFASPVERARTLLLHGLVLRRSGARREARHALEDAVASARLVPVEVWAARAERELAKLARKGEAPDRAH